MVETSSNGCNCKRTAFRRCVVDLKVYHNNSEILAIADTCSNEMDDKQFKVLNQLRTAIGLKPTEKDEKTVHN